MECLYTATFASASLKTFRVARLSATSTLRIAALVGGKPLAVDLSAPNGDDKLRNVLGRSQTKPRQSFGGNEEWHIHGEMEDYLRRRTLQ